MANITTDDIKTISDFPLLPKADIAPADVILVEDISASAYKRASLQDVVDKMNPIQSVNLTTAEYNALSDSEKMNGTYYNITDAESTVQDELATLSATVATQATTISSLQSNELKVWTNGETFNLGGDTDHTLTLNIPSTYNVQAIIPIGWTPHVTWATSMVFKGFTLSNNSLSVKTLGTTTQNYTIKYIVIYK